MMTVNLVEQATRVEILRPCRMEEAQCVVFGQGPMHTLYFSRSEWALLVLSGLWEAIRTLGWPVWDIVTTHRAPACREEDHLLVIATLFSRGRGVHLPEPPAQDHQTDYAKIRRALCEIYRVAEAYRNLQGIQTPLDVFPSPAYEVPALERAVEETHVETLLDLARHGEEGIFKDLARTLGVAADQIDALWTGTIARVRRER